MAEFYVSRLALSYTPNGSSTTHELLRAGDVLAAVPTASWAENTESIPLLGRAYAALRATPGLTRELELTTAVPGPSVAELTLRLRALEALNESPYGVITIEDAFHMGVPASSRSYLGTVSLSASLPLSAEEVPPLILHRYGLTTRAWGLLGIKMITAQPLNP